MERGHKTSQMEDILRLKVCERRHNFLEIVLANAKCDEERKLKRSLSMEVKEVKTIRKKVGRELNGNRLNRYQISL